MLLYFTNCNYYNALFVHLLNKLHVTFICVITNHLGRPTKLFFADYVKGTLKKFVNAAKTLFV